MFEFVFKGDVRVRNKINDNYSHHLKCLDTAIFIKKATIKSLDIPSKEFNYDFRFVLKIEALFYFKTEISV
jgi:hypothetical protein